MHSQGVRDKHEKVLLEGLFAFKAFIAYRSYHEKRKEGGQPRVGGLLPYRRGLCLSGWGVAELTLGRMDAAIARGDTLIEAVRD